MKLQNELTEEFLRQLPVTVSKISDAIMEKYIRIAENYAEIENVLAVLSVLDRNESYVVHGRFSDLTTIDRDRCSGKIPSIWEDEIFKAIHPDDLEMKLMQELLFFHYVNRQPRSDRFNHCLMQRLRMRGADGEWIETLHRLHYIPAEDGKTIRFALCLYGPMITTISNQSLVINTVTGERTILDNSVGKKILSRQEIEVLKLIDNGNRSKIIADILNISIHTVSRHRQNIIAKLKVRNSAEACKIARNLSLI